MVNWESQVDFDTFDIMSFDLSIESISSRAIRNLRSEKLKSGHAFMIHIEELEPEQSYLEFPSGAIQLVKASTSNQDWIVIRNLSEQEANGLRQRLQLSQPLVQK